MTTPLFPLPEEFNAASYFVDRHIAEGRSEKVAIECADRRVTYRQLFDSVNQVGNALKKSGVRPEERVFLLLLDTPEFAASFFRRDQDRSRARTGQHAAEAGRLRIPAQ